MSAPSALIQLATRLALSLIATGALTVVALCLPKLTIAQEVSAAATPVNQTDSRYYQDYQPVVVPTVPIAVPPPSQPATAQIAPTQMPPPPASAPIVPPPPIAPITPQSPAIGPPSANPPPGRTTPLPPASFNDPVWVVPSTAPTVPPQPVAVPPVGQPVTPPALTPAAAGRSPGGEVALQVTDVQIVGVSPDTQAFGLEIIQTKPGGGANAEQLQNDINTLQNSGFFSNVTVSTRTNAQGLSVTFYANPVILRALQLSNAKGLTLTAANEIFRDQFNQPITPTGLNQSVQQINDWYAKNEFILARVVSLQPTPQGIVVVEVAEGIVADVQVRFVNREGSTTDPDGKPIRYRTQDAFVRRQIKLQPGQAFQSTIAREDLARLQALGIFEQTNVTFEGDARNTIVVYNLQERPPRDLRFGGGFNDTLGLFGTVSITDVNFAGLGQRLGTTILAGTRDVQFDARFVSPYRDTEPNIPGYNANVFRTQSLSNVFTEEVRLANGDRVRERRWGGSAGIERPLGGGWNGNWGLNYTNVSMRDSRGDIFATDQLGNPLTASGTGRDDLFSFSFSALRDIRNNPINPSSGSLAQFNTEQFFPVGRASVLGTRFQANYSQYIPIKFITASHRTPPNPGEAQPETVALNIKGGTWVGDLPPYNAFVLGGPFSVRGWDTGRIATSRSFVEASAEYRFPIYRFIGGAAFVDFASDLGSSDDVPGQPGVVRGKPGTGLGFGFGLRVNSPLGIVRGDLGISNQGDVRFQFGFGQKF